MAERGAKRARTAPERDEEKGRAPSRRTNSVLQYVHNRARGQPIPRRARFDTQAMIPFRRVNPLLEDLTQIALATQRGEPDDARIEMNPHTRRTERRDMAQRRAAGNPRQLFEDFIPPGPEERARLVAQARELRNLPPGDAPPDFELWDIINRSPDDDLAETLSSIFGALQGSGRRRKARTHGRSPRKRRN